MTSAVDRLPMLSIIVPVYNTQERLEACLDSLLAQEMNDWELILVNDGSSDRSPEICRSYADRDRRIRFLSGPNAGAGAARNRGLETARGKWLAFCDSDDVTAPELYAVLMELAVRDRADLACCALNDIGPEEVKKVTDFPFAGRVLVSDRREIVERILLPLLTDDPQVHGYLVTCLFRRDIVEREKIRFAPEVSMKEDTLFLAEYLLHAERVSGVDRPLYDYIRFENSACTRYYRSDSEYFREKNWYLMSRERLRIFMKGGLNRSFPELHSGFLLRIFLHRSQMICCEPGLRYREKSALLKSLRQDARKAPPEFRRGAGILFRLALFHSIPLLVLLLFLKRKKDEICRRAEHLGDRKK